MMQLSKAAEVTNGHLFCADNVFSDVVIDSREAKTGSLFVAIAGQHQDGHDFVADAQQQGAVASLVSKRAQNTAVIEVDDSTLALGALARYWRTNFSMPVAGITGSNGKTTVTSMVAHILNVAGKCLSPKGSFNNQWGVPLTLLALRDSFDYAAIEMGMNHAGEIDYLSSIVKPTVALVNNIASAHLGGLGSIQAIAAAKSEIFSGMDQSGMVVINRDDHFSDFIEQQARNFVRADNIIGFSSVQNAEVSLCNLKQTSHGHQFDLVVADSRQSINLTVPGVHNVTNALAAAAVAWCMGAATAQIAQGLNSFVNVAGRLNIFAGLNHSVVIDDSYNANPSSVKAAIDVLVNYKKHTVLVLGAMAELGKDSNQLHLEVARYAKSQGIACLYCLKEQQGSDCYVSGFGDGAQAFDSLESLLTKLKSIANQETVILVKGSRSSSMERVVNHIIDTSDADAGRRSVC